MFQLKFIPAGEAAKYSRAPYFLPIQAADKWEADRIAYELSLMLGATTEGQNGDLGSCVYTRWEQLKGMNPADAEEEFSFYVVEV